MTSPFAAAAAAAAKAHDAVMGERFDYRPMKRATDVNAAPVIDPDRPVAEGVLMPFGEPSARADSGPVQTPGVTAQRPGHATVRPFVSLDLARLSYAPRAGDVLVRLAGGQRYRVAEVLPSTPGFARLDLNRI